MKAIMTCSKCQLTGYTRYFHFLFYFIFFKCMLGVFSPTYLQQNEDDQKKKMGINHNCC